MFYFFTLYSDGVSYNMSQSVIHFLSHLAPRHCFSHKNYKLKANFPISLKFPEY